MKITWIVAFYLIALLFECANSDESPGFFLKVVSKNIPRIGKRSDALENLLRKSKNIPRIGKRNENYVEPDYEDLPSWFTRFTNPSKRLLQNGPNDSFYFNEYNLVQPVNSNALLQLFVKDIIPSNGLMFISWKDFDKALQQDNELFSKISSIGKDTLTNVKEELKLRNQYASIYGNNNNEDFIYSNNEFLSDGQKDKMKYQL